LKHIILPKKSVSTAMKNNIVLDAFYGFSLLSSREEGVKRQHL